jgi:hypothetical protein
VLPNERRTGGREMGLRRRRLNIFRWVFSHECTQLGHRSIKIFRSEKITKKKTFEEEKNTQGTYTARVRIIAICALSTVRAWIGFPAACAVSSTTFQFSHNSSANPTTSRLSLPLRAFPHLSSTSTYILGVLSKPESSKTFQNSALAASNVAHTPEHFVGEG